MDSVFPIFTWNPLSTPFCSTLVTTAMQHRFHSGNGPKVNVSYYGHRYRCGAVPDYLNARGWERDWLIDWTWSENCKSLQETRDGRDCFIYRCFIQKQLTLWIFSRKLDDCAP